MFGFRRTRENSVEAINRQRELYTLSTLLYVIMVQLDGYTYNRRPHRKMYKNEMDKCR